MAEVATEAGPAVRPGRRAHFLAVGSLLLLTLLMFADVLVAPERAVLSARMEDIDRQFLHWREFGFSELARGNLALWNPHIFGGNSFFGASQSALLYPPNLLFLVLPTVSATNVSIALHVFLMAFFVYLFVVRRGASPLGGVVAGSMAAFGGAYFSRIGAGHLPILCSAPWIPLLLCAVDDLARRPRPGDVLVGAAAVGLMILAGHPQVAFIGGIAAAAVTLSGLFVARRRALLVAGVVAMAVLGAGLASVQLLTGISEVPETLRSGRGLDRSMSASYSMPPENLLCFLAPTVLGRHEPVGFFGRWFLWEGQPFVGLAGLFLAGVGAIFGRREVRRHAAAIAAVMVLLAFGGYLPVFGIVHEHLPGFSFFRSHGRFLLPATLFLSLLAAAGTDALLRDGRDGRGRRASAVAMLALAAALAGAAVAARSEALCARFLALIAVPGQNFSAAQLSSPEVIARVSRWSSGCLLIAAGTAAAAGLLLLPGRRARPLACALALLSVAEPFAWSRLTDRPAWDPRQPSLAGLPGFLATVGKDVRTLNSVLPDAAMSAGTEEIWGYDSFVNRRWVELVCFLMGKDPDRAAHFQTEEFARPHRLLAMLRCGYLLVPGPEGVSVLRSTLRPMPRFCLVGSCRVVAGRDAVLAALDDPAFDPWRTVILESEPAVRPSGAERDLGIVRVSEETTDGATIEAFMAEPALLLVTDQWSRHWKAEAIGPAPQPAYEVLPANHALRAIPLSPGRHRFRMEYRPAMYDTGRWISLAALAVFLALCVAAAVRRRGK